MSESQGNFQVPKNKFSELFYNRFTYIGVFLALIVFIAELFLFGIDLFTPHSNVYLGIFAYVVLPVFLIFGLLLIPLGAWWKWNRVRKGLTSLKPKFIYLVPSIPQHRNAILVFVVGTIILLGMTAIGSYKAFHYTESVHFCGVVCHKVMEPEHTTYLQSPHARVKCVECHIGAGANWYMRSKLSGFRQVYKTLTNTYDRPITTPLHNLRPAKEICEACHWPGKYFTTSELRRTYFSQEDASSKWHLRMIVPVGQNTKRDQGVHAHMYAENDIYYVADNEKRQEISWIKSVNTKSGEENIYVKEGSPYAKEMPPSEKVRKMDCIDCHNRPSHHFNPPTTLMNQAILEGRIAADIPSIKAKAIEVMSKKYASRKEAVAAIKKDLFSYYKTEHQEFYTANPEKVENAIAEIIVLFENNIFPEMQVRWDNHPDNIGHLNSPGCFRCHDGEHHSVGGKTISKDCNICHTIVEQGPPGALEKNIDGVPFRHPFEDDGMWKEMNCSDCHG